MKFDPPLSKARFIRRYKRFLTDIELPSRKVITIHCPNTGSMKHCLVEGSDCWYSSSENPKRKYRYTWEIVTALTGHLAGINTHRANALVREAIEKGVISELADYSTIRSEVRYGEQNRRIDFLLSADDKPNCYVEVKNVTFGFEDGLGLFPDAVSVRGAKHLQELMKVVTDGSRAVLIYCVQHTGITSVAPTDDIDPSYCLMLKQAVNAGVEVLAYKADISSEAVAITRSVPFRLNG